MLDVLTSGLKLFVNILESFTIIFPWMRQTDYNVISREIGMRLVRLRIQLKNPIIIDFKGDLNSPTSVF